MLVSEYLRRFVEVLQVSVCSEKTPMAARLVSSHLVAVVAADVAWTDLQVLASPWTEVETIGGQLLIVLEVPVVHLTDRGLVRVLILR